MKYRNSISLDYLSVTVASVGSVAAVQSTGSMSSAVTFLVGYYGLMAAAKMFRQDWKNLNKFR